MFITWLDTTGIGVPVHMYTYNRQEGCVQYKAPVKVNNNSKGSHSTSQEGQYRVLETQVLFDPPLTGNSHTQLHCLVWREPVTPTEEALSSKHMTLLIGMN